MKTGFWRGEAKAAYRFARSILAAFIANRRPQDIKCPDGSPFLWPSEKQIESQQESSVRQCYQLSVRIQRGDAISEGEASAELRWLRWIDPGTWRKVDKDHHSFVTQVLRAVRNGQQPSDIRKPDGNHFVWPTTEVGVDVGDADLVDPPVDYGVLRAMGYRVGKKARPDSERQITLENICVGSLEPARSVANLDEWGCPCTGKRLRKLANTIASLSRNMKRKIRRGSTGMSELAVYHWNSDLAHLKCAYYDGKYEPYFSWPQIPAQR